jgi:hypothetical protein
MLFVIITCGMIISHTTFLAANRRDIDARYRQQALSQTFARSGLTDAHGWFARQSVQPVVEFRPLLAPEADPPLLDTLDPTVGLVREFEVHSGLWGRYEIRLDEVADVSGERGITSAGSAWQLRSRGYVFQRIDPTRPFDQAPNRLVAASALSTEMRGIQIRLPAQSGLIVDDEAALSILGRGRELGNGKPGYVALRNSIGFTLGLIGTLTGTPSSLINAAVKLKPKDVFGMHFDRLRQFADVSYDAAQRFRYRYRAGQIVYHRGNLTADRAIVADGPILLIVDGNLSVLSGTNTDMHGLVYVTGNADVRGPFTLHGSLVVLGSCQLGGPAAGDVTIEYLASALDQLQQSAAQYRLSRQLTSTR